MYIVHSWLVLIVILYMIFLVHTIRIVCQTIAYMEQFTFISAMTWQTQIGQNNIEKLRGSPGLRTYELSGKHILVGYGLPALLSASTATMEFVGQKCSFYKPRFGER